MGRVQQKCNVQYDLLVIQQGLHVFSSYIMEFPNLYNNVLTYLIRSKIFLQQELHNLLWFTCISHLIIIT